MLYEETVKEIQRYVSRQNLMLLFFRIFSRAHASPSTMFDIEYDNPADPPTVQGNCLLLKLTCKYIFYCFLVRTDCLNHSPYLSVSFSGKSVLD
jgi:hypothetical protein